MHHLRVDADSPEWPLIQGYIDAAEDIAAQYLNRKFYADSDALTAAVNDVLYWATSGNGKHKPPGTLYSSGRKSGSWHALG
ncbi:head-tail connector protein [Salmonella enterica subsp. diarizonae serovar 48:i:z]|nr:head-tail connector protein [Salmonella enterica subsp. diarizonae serovar 48:i:z]